MSVCAQSQESSVWTNLHTTRRGIFAFPPLQKFSKISQQTTSAITKQSLQINNSANFTKMNAIQTD